MMECSEELRMLHLRTFADVSLSQQTKGKTGEQGKVEEE